VSWYAAIQKREAHRARAYPFFVTNLGTDFFIDHIGFRSSCIVYTRTYIMLGIKPVFSIVVSRTITPECFQLTVLYYCKSRFQSALENSKFSQHFPIVE